MPNNYICSVAGRFPENYRIGVEAGVWGVEERYRQKISAARPGDLLVFAMDAKFRSIHRIESRPFQDATPLWPEKDGSHFPHRVRISRPLFLGNVEIRSLADRISFMRGKQWGGTLQGGHGVFNRRATDEDIAVIQAALRPVSVSTRYLERRHARPAEPSRTETLLVIGEERLDEMLTALMQRRGLIRRDEYSEDLRRAVLPGEGVVTGLFAGEIGSFLIVDLHVSTPAPSAVLDLLRRMSWIRQKVGGVRDVAGLILCQTVDPDMFEVTGEIPNLNVHPFEVRLEVGNGPGDDVRRLSA